MAITLVFDEGDIPTLSDGLQSLPYKTVAPLINKLQTQINEQVVKKEGETPSCGITAHSDAPEVAAEVVV